MIEATDAEKKIIMAMRKKARETVRPFVLMNAGLDREEFEVAARKKFAEFLVRDEAKRGENFDAIDAEWSAALWRALWHEYDLIRNTSGGGNSSVN